MALDLTNVNSRCRKPYCRPYDTATLTTIADSESIIAVRSTVVPEDPSVLLN